MDDLKPCPFCGGKAKLHIGLSEFVDGEVQCDCGASAGNHSDAAQAVTAWNTRAAADRIEALEAALRDASDKAAVIAEAWVRRAMHLSPDGYEIERHHGAMASQAANDIRRALTAPLHPAPSPDPQSDAETAPR